MSITTTNINTKGAVVTIGGTVGAVDGDGYYWGTTSGIDLGCTKDGVKVQYNFEKTDIFCDQTLAAVASSITSETATITFSMLESNVSKLQYAIQQCVETEDSSEAKIGVGGITTITYVPLKLEIPDQDDNALLTTWTFFKTLSGGIDEINFERINTTQVNVTFTAYADTTHAIGHQLFSVHQALV